MKINDEYLKQIADYVVKYTTEKASLRYGINQESIGRYMREARSRGLIEEDEDIEIDQKANVLLLDIETAPINAAVWGLWKQNVHIEQIYSEWFMLTWSAKWLYESDVFSDKLTQEEALAQDDKRISESIWKFVDYADVIIAHNAARFDMPRLNTRFLLNGLNPPSPYQTIDTLRVAKKNFGFSSNKLDFIAKKLGLEGKSDDGGMETWNNILRRGDEDALKTMEDYNRQDVLVLEEVYVKLRPWIKSHPNLALHYEDIGPRCPNCGSTSLIWEQGKFYVTPMNKYSTVRCGDCGAIGRSKSSALTSQQRSELISTTAR